jgi:hypothetical protein
MKIGLSVFGLFLPIVSYNLSGVSGVLVSGHHSDDGGSKYL